MVAAAVSEVVWSFSAGASAVGTKVWLAVVISSASCGVDLLEVRQVPEKAAFGCHVHGHGPEGQVAEKTDSSCS